jgi:hypothetical protein
VKGNGFSTFSADNTYFNPPGTLPTISRKNAGPTDFCVYPFQLTVLSAFGLRLKVIPGLLISLKKTAKRIAIIKLRIN